MAQRAIREYHAKKMLAENLSFYLGDALIYSGKVALVTPETDLEELKSQHKWLTKEKLVVKPDQLFGKRGKHGLLRLNAQYKAVAEFIKEKLGKEITIGKVTDKLTHFIIEPYIQHEQAHEYYLAIQSNRDGDEILFSTKGGVDVEENWANVVKLQVPVLESIDNIAVEEKLLAKLSKAEQKTYGTFIRGLFKFYTDCGYAFLELNPFTIVGNSIIPFDMKARLDDCASFESASKWGAIEFPAPFGRKFTKEEDYIKELDSQTGASLKLTVLNPKGSIWTMVAGGGASIIYTDTISDLGYADELANYGEYSGDPSREFTYLYAKTILELMTREKAPKKEKVLLIGGGIANFTDVAETFAGIMDALIEYKSKLVENNVKIYVRRGGPNYQEGLKKMRELGVSLGVPIEVYGPETHMTKIVPLSITNLKKGK